MFGLTRFTDAAVVGRPVVNAVAEEEVLYAVAEEEDTGGKEYREDGGVFGSVLLVADAGKDEVERTESRG